MVARDGGVCLLKVKLEGGRGFVVNGRLRGGSGQDGRGSKKMKELAKHYGGDGRCIELNECRDDSGTNGETVGVEDAKWKL